MTRIQKVNETMDNDHNSVDENGFEIAVIGMAGRFPGAADIDEFWKNLQDGKESISIFTDEEILSTGVDPAVLSHPNFVKAGGVLDDVDMFDAAFFGCSHREARSMDPQHRIFLECSYQALQHAGIDPQKYKGSIGVFAGANANTYSHKDQSGAQGNSMQDFLGNDRSFLSTRVSYKLNLKGPSLTIQTACSTSLVAAHVAYQSLLSGECDIALGGGVSIRFPQKLGYFYEKEGIQSPDGHCRAFDKLAQGTVGGEGVGVVVLKRLADAVADGNSIHAIIKGSALNNDGSRKVGFTAPSVEGQADVITRALVMAEVDPDSIGYVETHGTGTLLGDPIEVAALTRAFRSLGSRKRQFCAITSLKSNMGHLDSAAGIAGLIKTILTLKHRQIPPSLHYKEANPQIDFSTSPFFVNHELSEWRAESAPLRAGVSSFGIGGSNVHMVLEEAARSRTDDTSARAASILPLSTRTETALDVACQNLAAHLATHPDLPLADAAYTLQTGRQHFQHRRMLVCEGRQDAISGLESLDPKRLIYGNRGDQRRSIVFMFPGQGAQYVDMGRDLYKVEPCFRKHFDECCELLKQHIDIDLRDLIFPDQDVREEASQQLNQTALTQPALFAVEYSLARLWISWGVKPQALIGHSIGEYVAACLAGVFSLADALSLVCARARLMQTMPPGSMLAVPLSADQVQKILGDGLSIAAINEASMCVVSGTSERVARLESELARQGMECRRLHTSHAFHSEMMEPIVEPFEKLVRGVDINKPKIPYISNLTGSWITAEDVADPTYWGRHLRGTVKFAAGLETLMENPASLFLEAGPGQTLSTLTRSHPSKRPEHLVISSMRHSQNQQSDSAVLLNGLGRLWLAGIEVDWSSFYGDEARGLVPLPGYPFERQSFWIDQRLTPVGTQAAVVNKGKIDDPGHWFYIPAWKSAIEPLLRDDAKLRDGCWLVFSDESSVAEKIIDGLGQCGCELVVVTPADSFSSLDKDRFTVLPGRRADMTALFDELHLRGKSPRTILHLWTIAPSEPSGSINGGEMQALTRGFYGVLHIAQALAEKALSDSIELVVVTCGSQSVSGGEILYPQHAAVAGICHVIPQEQDRVRCRIIDIVAKRDDGERNQMAQQVLTELKFGSTDPVVALRNGGRWVQVYDPVVLDEPPQPGSCLREKGVYLITGGFGNVGLHLGHYLARSASARLVLLGRSQIPPKDNWDENLASHGKESDVGRKIVALRALEEAGAEVMALSADVTDEAQMRAAVEQVNSEFGQINGVIHAAAATSQESFQLLKDLDAESCELQFIPKIGGLQVLDRVLQEQSPDFCILMSSLASLLGGLRFAAYASANAYMDAFARRCRAGAGLPWLSVNWDGWHFGNPRSGENSTVARLAMTPAEGVSAFARLLRVKAVPQLVISTCDLQARLDQWAKTPEVMDTGNTAPGDTGRSPQSGSGEIDFTQEGIERRLCAIWGELIGVDGIGVDDNFFDLGGDSLLALQVTSRLRDGLIADLSAATVLESPTIAELTRHILQQQQQSMSNSSDKASALLQRIKSISPEERDKLLAEARQSRSTGK